MSAPEPGAADSSARALRTEVSHAHQAEAAAEPGAAVSSTRALRTEVSSTRPRGNRGVLYKAARAVWAAARAWSMSLEYRLPSAPTRVFWGWTAWVIPGRECMCSDLCTERFVCVCSLITQCAHARRSFFVCVESCVCSAGITGTCPEHRADAPVFLVICDARPHDAEGNVGHDQMPRKMS